MVTNELGDSATTAEYKSSGFVWRLEMKNEILKSYTIKMSLEI